MTANWPTTYEEAVTRLLDEIPDEERYGLMTTPRSDLNKWHYILGMTIRERYGLWQGNIALLRSCAAHGGGFGPDSTSMAIIKVAWARLREGISG